MIHTYPKPIAQKSGRNRRELILLAVALILIVSAAIYQGIFVVLPNSIDNHAKQSLKSAYEKIGLEKSGQLVSATWWPYDRDRLSVRHNLFDLSSQSRSGYWDYHYAYNNVNVTQLFQNDIAKLSAAGYHVTYSDPSVTPERNQGAATHTIGGQKSTPDVVVGVEYSSGTNGLTSPLVQDVEVKVNASTYPTFP